MVGPLFTALIQSTVTWKCCYGGTGGCCYFCVSVVAAIDVAEVEKQEVSEETIESWCVEEQAMEVDISMLQQVEELERKVISAGLQVKVPANRHRL